MDSRDKFLSNFLIICNKYSQSIAISYASDLENTFGITFSQLNKLSNDLSKYFSELFGTGPRYIGVELSDYFFLPAVILAIWRGGFVFAGASTQYTAEDTLKFLDFLNVTYVVTDSDHHNYNGEVISTFCVYNQKFFVWRRDIEIKERSSRLGDMCYGIMTSGTTGVTKIIQVPWSCILPNAEELSMEFGVNEFDCLFLASPCTFDPFFIELFLFLLSGCTLSIVPSHIKLCSSTLLRILFHAGSVNSNDVPEPVESQENDKKFFCCEVTRIVRKPVTFLQMTPSFFKRWRNKEIKEFILSPSSTLKNLVLGGELFPTEILQMRSPLNKTRIFNIYGITEISCWAFLNEIQQDFSGTEVSLGKNLNGIEFEISGSSELIIGSKTRICMVNDENISELPETVFRKTGDIVEVRNENIYFVSRDNQMVKKYGIKMCLRNVEEAFLKVNNSFRNVFCIYDEAGAKLGLFYLLSKPSIDCDYKRITYEEFIDRGHQVPSASLKTIEKPDDFIEILQLPVNLHGKCNKGKLLQFLKSLGDSQRNELDLSDRILNVFKEVLGSRKLVNLTKSFSELGGTSIEALQIVGKFENIGWKVPQNFIANLLDGKVDVNHCIEVLKSQIVERPHKRIKIHTLENNLKISVKWKFDLSKCIDATPTVTTCLGKRTLFVGSHSSKLACIATDDGSSLWTISLGDRIESGFTVTKDGSRGIIGCYDGFVYCLSVADGTLFWKYKTGDMIKSTPCLSSDGKLVFVSSYDGCLYCFSVDNGGLLKKLEISEKGIFASGLVSTALKTFFIANLDGGCLAVCEDSLQERWKVKLKSPVFASPCLLSNNLIVFAEVSGILHCFNITDNFKVWEYVAQGLIYSSPTSYLLDSIELILFGCYDHCIYCLEHGGSVKLRWRQRLGCAIFGRLSIFSLHDSIIACAATTEGFIYFCDCRNGEILTRVKLDGEVFSSPVYTQNELFVGCRDNNVYGFEVSVTQNR